MRAHEIETWTINVIDRVLAGQPNEDSRVELKSKWPESVEKAARQIAGHANAARGENILWIVGVDEKSQTVTGALHEELANWYPQVQKQFDGLAPQLTHYNVPYKNQVVVALLFETDRAPFVVKNPAFGKNNETVQLEVPWRENTSTRSARRDELLKILSPLQKKPRITILDATLRVFNVNPEMDTTVYAAGQSPMEHFLWRLETSLYIEANDEGRIIIPYHRITGQLDCSIEAAKKFFDDMRFRSDSNSPLGPYHSEFTIHAAGEIGLSGFFRTPPLTGSLFVDATAIISLEPTNVEEPIKLEIPLTPRGIDHKLRDNLAAWDLKTKAN